LLWAKCNLVEPCRLSHLDDAGRDPPEVRVFPRSRAEFRCLRRSGRSWSRGLRGSVRKAISRGRQPNTLACNGGRDRPGFTGDSPGAHQPSVNEILDDPSCNVTRKFTVAFAAREDAALMTSPATRLGDIHGCLAAPRRPDRPHPYPPRGTPSSPSATTSTGAGQPRAGSSTGSSTWPNACRWSPRWANHEPDASGGPPAPASNPTMASAWGGLARNCSLVRSSRDLSLIPDEHLRVPRRLS